MPNQDNPLRFTNVDLEDLESILELAEVTENDLDKAIEDFNKNNPDTAGILESEVKE